MIPFLIFIHFFIILPLLPFILTDEEPNHQQRCQPFDCGSLGEVKAPFSNISNPECALQAINCTGQTPTIDFKPGGKLYDVKSILSNDTILVEDQILQRQLDSRNCDFQFDSTLHISPIIHVSPLISFEFINSFLTLFKCSKHHPQFYETHIFPPEKSKSYEGCKDDYVIYYNYTEQLKWSQLPESLDYNCSVVYLPLIQPPPSPDYARMHDLFALLSAQFYLKWKVLPACDECANGGGQCLKNYDNQPFQCLQQENAPSKAKRKNTKILIGTSAGIGGSLVTIILVFIIFLLWRRKNNHDTSSTLISRSISPDLSLKPDSEKGGTYFRTPIFPYKELEEATNNFDSSKKLGDGGYGTVYHGELQDGRAVAVKRLYENNYKRVEQFMNEVRILSLLRHKNLVTLYGCTSRHSRELLLVYEYVQNGTVADHLHGEQAKAGLVTWPIRMSIAIESASALAYLHASDIIHRDVKTNNILLDNNFHVKVADFGLSRLFPTDVTHISTAPQGTPGYVDPEYYQCYQLTDKSDVYSFGVLLIELISSKPAVDISRHRHEINLSSMAINKIRNDALQELVDPSLGSESDHNVRRMITLVAELAFRCLQQDSDIRPTMAEVVEVLKGIENEGSKLVKGEKGVEIPAEDVRLLNNIQSHSPDSVTGIWSSVYSTPNTSI